MILSNAGVIQARPLANKQAVFGEKMRSITFGVNWLRNYAVRVCPQGLRNFTSQALSVFTFNRGYIAHLVIAL
ncbi:MAG: hypothetical protein CMF67_03895 [Magnetovibrio sp.]|nr:hypothetical protein [Magnetovibrio sp.]